MTLSTHDASLSTTPPPVPTTPAPRRRVALVVIGLGVVAVLAVFVLWPRLTRPPLVAAPATAGHPRVVVVATKPGPPTTALDLPGGLESTNEVAIFARADGYVRRRLVDMGDVVRTGQVLAEIESPELAEQIGQAAATVQRSKAGLRQSEALLEQSRVNLRLAEATSQRWEALVSRGVLSKQDGDEKRTAYEARQAEVSGSQAAVAVANESVRATESDHRRLQQLQGFREIRAPFAGMITVRNADTGTLVSAGSSGTLVPLFRLAALDRLRVPLLCQIQ